MEKLTVRDAVLAISIPLAAVFILAVVLAMIGGCAEAKVACQVIRAADQVCTVIEYVGADGVAHRDPVDPNDLQLLAEAVAGRRMAAERERDAGKD